MNQHIGVVADAILRVLQYKILASPATLHQEQILGKRHIPPPIFPTQNDLPIQGRHSGEAEKEKDDCAESTLFHDSSIHYNRNAQNTT
jgi:hypothetical protein